MMIHLTQSGFRVSKFNGSYYQRVLAHINASCLVYQSPMSMCIHICIRIYNTYMFRVCRGGGEGGGASPYLSSFMTAC